MTELILVRHGETVWHAENRYAGSSDIELTSRGQDQAAQLAEWASLQADLTDLWCSPLGRARATAAPVAEATGLTPRLDPRLREVDFGLGEGMTVAEMQERFPDRLAAFRADPVNDHLPGGEDPRDAVERGVSCLREIAQDGPDARVLVVAHTTLIRLCLCRLLGIPESEYRRVFPFLRNAGLTAIRLEGDSCSLLEFNTPIDLVTAPTAVAPH